MKHLYQLIERINSGRWPEDAESPFEVIEETLESHLKLLNEALDELAAVKDSSLDSAMNRILRVEALILGVNLGYATAYSDDELEKIIEDATKDTHTSYDEEEDE